MEERAEPTLRDCLAYAVLDDYASWLGGPSLRHLESLLYGAATRAELGGQVLPSWRVFGPLEIPDFYRPLIARTGHPTLSIKWSTAMEIHHLSLEDAMRELKKLIERWVELNGLVTGDVIGSGPQPADGQSDGETRLREFLKKMARRPGMYLGENGGWALRCFLTGMDRGGDWLGLPALPGLRGVVDGIETRSEEGYGSRFAAYRVYRESPAELLSWVGIGREKA